MRELAANVGGPAEQSLLTSNSSPGVCETNPKLQDKPLDPVPDLLTSLYKSHAKGKRSRNNHVASRKRLNGTRVEVLQHEECTKLVSSSTSKHIDQSNSTSSNLSTFAAENEVTETTPRSLAPEKCQPVAEGGVNSNPSGTFDNLNKGESPCEKKELTSSGEHIELNNNNLHRQQESVSLFMM